MQGLEEFRQHLGGRLTITMLRGVGDPIDVHEIDHHHDASSHRATAADPPGTRNESHEARGGKRAVSPE